MADVWDVTVSVRDIDGDPSTWGFYLDTALAPAAVATAAEAIIEAADVLNGGVVTGVRATLVIDTTGWTLKSTATDYDRRQGGRFFFNAANGQKPFITLPTFRQGVYVPAGSENIDKTDTEVAAFLAALLGTSSVSNVGSELLTSGEAYETFGGKR